MIVLIDRKAKKRKYPLCKSASTGWGSRPISSKGRHAVLALVAGVDKSVDIQQFKTLPLIEEILPLSRPYKLAAKQIKNARTVIECKGRTIGGEQLAVMAGPCSIESEEQIMACAKCVKENGGNILRGGAFKPRTSPYAFQGLGVKGLNPSEGRGNPRPPTVSEVMDTDRSNLSPHTPISCRSAPATCRTSACSKSRPHVNKPVLLKRGLSRDHRGPAHGGRVHPQRRQPQCHPLRARHPHLRDLHAATPSTSPPSPSSRTDPPAHHRRSQPRHRPPRKGRRDGPGSHRRRRRRPHGRNPSCARQSLLRRRSDVEF